MKPVKNFLFVLVLVFTIAVNTSAGEQHVPGYVPPPPDSAKATSLCDDNYPSTTDCAEPVEDNTVETSDYWFYEALAALLSMY